MENLEVWSFLWDHPEDFLIVRNSALFLEDEGGMIFERKTRDFFGIEDDDLLRSLVRRMKQAGVECVESRDFRPEPTEAVQIIESGLAAGLSQDEINRRLRSLETQPIHEAT